MTGSSFPAIASSIYWVLVGASLLLAVRTLLRARAAARRRAGGSSVHEVVWTVVPVLLVIALSLVGGVAGVPRGGSESPPPWSRR